MSISINRKRNAEAGDDNLLEQVSLTVLFSHRLVSVEVRIRDLSRFACATCLDTHQEGDPDSRDDARDDIAVTDGEEEALDGGGLGSEEVVEGRDGGGECGKGDAFRHDGLGCKLLLMRKRCSRGSVMVV